MPKRGPGCKCCNTPSCSPCSLDTTINYTLTVSNSFGYSEVWTLYYVGIVAGNPRWESGCVSTRYPFLPIIFFYQTIYRLECRGGVVEVSAIQYGTACVTRTGCGGSGTNCAGGPANDTWTLQSYSCSPFHMQWQGTSVYTPNTVFPATFDLTP